MFFVLTAIFLLYLGFQMSNIRRQPAIQVLRDHVYETHVDNQRFGSVNIGCGSTKIIRIKKNNKYTSRNGTLNLESHVGRV